MPTELELRGAREIGTLCGLSEVENIEFLAKATRFKFIAEDAEEHARIKQDFVYQLNKELEPVLRWVKMIIGELAKSLGQKECVNCREWFAPVKCCCMRCIECCKPYSNHKES